MNRCASARAATTAWPGQMRCASTARLFLTTGEYDRAIETARSCIDLYHEMGREQVSLANIMLGKALRLKGERMARKKRSGKVWQRPVR